MASNSDYFNRYYDQNINNIYNVYNTLCTGFTLFLIPIFFYITLKQSGKLNFG